MASRHDASNNVHNVAGAIIFTAYVLAALFLTSLIVLDLYKAYQAQSSLSSKEIRRTSQQLQAFVALAVLSFSTLSYHMLSYLILSYRSWSMYRNLEPLQGLQSPTLFSGVTILGYTARTWQWLTQSTLFHDFARTICTSSANFWWTQQALLATIASALFISIEGQILPISFAQSLFFIAMILMPVPEPGRKLLVPSVLVQCLPLAAYYISVLSAPFSVGKPGFIPIIVIIRVLLVCPFILRLPALRSLSPNTISARSLHAGYSASYKLALFCSSVLFVQQTALSVKEHGINQVLAAVNPNPAVSALGYDFVLHVVITCAWLMYNSLFVNVAAQSTT
ncbi:MAG: hypothetical protein Q9184_000783 [Pyrenodesmia sp. 2 TL-2023]